jgi:hypothetical protein
VKVFLRTQPDSVYLQARVEDEDRLGDIMREIKPGSGFAGYSFEELLALGDGGHELAPRPLPGPAATLPA